MPVEGSMQISLLGGLSGTIHPGTYVPCATACGTSSERIGEPAKVLRMDCGFQAWEGVATAARAPLGSWRVCPDGGGGRRAVTCGERVDCATAADGLLLHHSCGFCRRSAMLARN